MVEAKNLNGGNFACCLLLDGPPDALIFVHIGQNFEIGQNFLTGWQNLLLLDLKSSFQINSVQLIYSRQM
jgi:hypothetical protein